MSNISLISDSFNLQKGGALFDPVKAQLSANSEYIFISLGGMGLATLSRIKTKIVRECDVPTTTKVTYLALDTDTDLMNTFKKEHQDFVALANNECVLLQEGVPSNALELNQRGQLSQTIKDWLNPDLNHTIDRHGASGIRQVGRFFLSYNSNFTTTKAALQRISPAQGREVYVYFICGIAGGTGSGGFVDMAYLIRETFKLHGGDATRHFKGFLYLPDTRKVSDATTRQNQYRNGCAALKELNYFMNLKNAGKGTTTNSQDLTAKYSYTYPSGENITSNENIFDQCTLVSGADVGGLGVKVDEATTLMIASSIVNQIVEANSNDGNNQTFNSQISNFTSSSPVTVTGPNRHLFPLNANYCYMAYGYSEVRLPTQECYAYATEMIFQAVNDMYQSEMKHFRETQGEDADKLMAACHLNNLNHLQQSLMTNAVFSMARVGVVPRPTLAELAPQMKNNPNAIEFAWQRFEDSLQTVAATNVDNVVDSYTTELNNQMDMNFQQNPFRTIIFTNLLINVNGNEVRHKKCLVEQILALRSAIQNDITNSLLLINQTQQGYSMALNKYNNAGLLAKGGAMKELFDATEAKYQCVYNKFIKERMLEAIDKLLNNLLMTHSKYFDVYTNVLSTFKDVLAENKSYLVNAELRTSGSSSVFSYDPAPLYADEQHAAVNERHTRLIDHIKNVVARVDKVQFLKSFMQTIQGKRDEWMAILDADANNTAQDYDKIEELKKTIKGFFKQQITNLANMTLEDYLTIAYKDEGMTDDQAMISVAQDLYTQLSSHSTPLYKTGRHYDLKNMLGGLSYTAICVPQVAHNLFKAIQNLPGIAANTKLYSSTSSNAVYMYQIYYGLPAFILEQLEEMEKAYDDSLNMGVTGTHLEENPQTDRVWRDFPMPLVREMWDHTRGGVDSIPHAHEDEVQKQVHDCVADLNERGILIMTSNPTTNTSSYEVKVPQAFLRPDFVRNHDKNGQKVEGGERFPKFDREDFITKSYRRLTDENPDLYDVSYDKFLRYFDPNVVTVKLNQTYQTLPIVTDADFELDLRGNIERLKMLQDLVTLYDYAMEPVNAVNKVINQSVEALSKIDVFANAIISGAIAFDPDQRIWTFSNDLRLKNPVFLKLKTIKGFLTNAQAKVYITAYYLYEGYRALSADEDRLEQVKQFIVKQTNNLIVLADENESEYEKQFAERESRKEKLIEEVEALLNENDSKKGGLAYGGEAVRDQFIRLFAGMSINDPVRSTPEFFNDLVSFYTNMLEVLNNLG